jgi:hypothetical protein
MVEAMAFFGTVGAMWSLIMYLVTMIGAAVIASAKGRSGFGYFVLAFLFPFVGLIIAAGMPVYTPPTRAVAPT